MNREFGAKFLIAGVRRIKEPGVKFDTMLVLEGRQGVGKSRLAARLAVRSEWFCGSLNLNADAKTKAELVARAWIVECQELDGARKATLDAIKSFLATQSDVYRPAYARNAASYPRHCVIIGTTNEDAYLRDQSGNRRYRPVRVGSIDIDRFGEDVDQLWAEAAMREQAGGIDRAVAASSRSCPRATSQPHDRGSNRRHPRGRVRRAHGPGFDGERQVLVGV